jgi:hypothetical protein
MKVAEDDIKTKTSTKEQRIAFENNGGSYFEQNKKLMVGQPDGIFTWEQIEEIKSGQKLPYYGAVLAYTDDVSKAKKVFYYVEACFYYNGIRGNIMQCATHNFPRHDHL